MEFEFARFASRRTRESDNGQQYKEYITQAAGNKANIVGAQVLGGELWFN